MWREGSQASQLTQSMGEGSFHIILFKTQRFFLPDKYILKIKMHHMRSSGLHGICRIKVAAFQETPLHQPRSQQDPSHPGGGKMRDPGTEVDHTLHCQTVSKT